MLGPIEGLPSGALGNNTEGTSTPCDSAGGPCVPVHVKNIANVACHDGTHESGCLVGA